MKGTATTCAIAISAVLSAASVHAQTPSWPVTAAQRATAQQVAQQGVPLHELSPQAPDVYTVKAGDTLWGIAGIFLVKQWRWPELWGMNLDAIRNPHLIYPGQVLYLEKHNGYARLSTSRSGNDEVRLSPRVRTESALDLALPTLQMHLLEPFMSEPIVLDANTLASAPRIIAASDERMMLSQGDRGYARAPEGAPLQIQPGVKRTYRLFREAVPIKDPITKEILGYEAQHLGSVRLERSESPEYQKTAASVLVLSAKEEVRAGDRMVPEPDRQYTNFVPHAPVIPIEARVASLYGSNSVRYGTQHQVVAINKGTQDGVLPGMVLSLINQGRTVVDKTGERREKVRLPDEENGLGMVFRSFDRVAYVLIMDVQRGVEVGDLLTNPR